MMSSDTPSQLKPALMFTHASGQRAGEDRFRLLDAIARLGSISAAAREIGISYKAAWDAVNVLNNLFARPLVLTSPGGRRGGGAEVTPEGHRTIAMHQRLSQSLRDMIADVETAFARDMPPEYSTPSIWSFLMKTSARNNFQGHITNIETGAINTEVTLRISDAIGLAIVMTNHSARDLGLAVGQDAFALIKASTPILMTDSGDFRTSARNRIVGTVQSVEPGAVNSEVVLDIGAGKTLTAIITDDSTENLGLQPGAPCCALIKASQIILCPA
ncbi:TOBE domain-containing protein [Thalassospira sp. MA62]|nr:TOBE domain-containing protein [Thalassospira sp. MA62]